MAVNVLLPLLIPLGEQITNGTGNLYFSKSTYEVHVAENSAPLELVTLEAKSNTTYGVTHYKIVGGDEGRKFSANSRTGVLVLNSPLDYESQNSYEIIVGAQRGHERALGRVVVKVHDRNDQAPTFARPLYETQMTEEDDRHLPKRILQVTATDRDISDKGKLSYSLTGDGVAPNPMHYVQLSSSLVPKLRPIPKESEERSKHFHSVVNYLHRQPLNSFDLLPVDNSSLLASSLPYFAINSSSGDIQLLQPLDRDAPNGREKWVLVVTATDGLHETSTTLHVNVKDINDNAPFFVKDVIEGFVLENSPAGSEVVTVEAIDLDDPSEGNHAKLSFSLEKNVIDEKTGRPIFVIDQQTGRISTALCCLDREKTSSYAIQVVATDGGGLKGTGSVLVTIADENDVAPRFTVAEWLLSLPETAKLNTSLALISVQDPDSSNNFSFKIIPNSGYGWDRFLIVPAPPDAGSLMAVKPLDFEDPKQRSGFRFKIEVSDGYLAGSNTSDPHTDTVDVVISLIDNNDNDPKLTKSWLNLTLPEDTPVGTLLAEFPASDDDHSGKSKIFYQIPFRSESSSRFSVDAKGNIRLKHSLDRELASQHSVVLLAIDEGVPARTASATLFIKVTDVNDNPPFIKSPKNLFLTENTSPTFISDVILDDLDDWSLGNGPPFSISLDKNAPPEIKRSFSIGYDAAGDNGHGKGILSSLKQMDREEGTYRLLPLVVMDGKGQSATVTFTVTLGDVNDNPMLPGSKTVNVTRIKHQLSKMPLGRIFVQDQDDWDYGSKIWKWDKDLPHPLFSLERNSGELFAKPEIKDGVYRLYFRVSDDSHNQRNVPANVTVQINTLDIESEIHPAVPILISSHTPEQLITKQGDSESPLESLLRSASSLLDLKIDVLALEEGEISGGINDYFAAEFQGSDVNNYDKFINREHNANKAYLNSGLLRSSDTSENNDDSTRGEDYSSKLTYLKVTNSKEIPGFKVSSNEKLEIEKSFSNQDTNKDEKVDSFLSTTLWVTSNTRRPLDQLLLINRAKISELSGVKVGDVGVGICARYEPASHLPVRLRHKTQQLKSEKLHRKDIKNHFYLNGKKSWVVDANTTALVTPRVWPGVGCSCLRDQHLRSSHKNLPIFQSQPLQVRRSMSGVSSCHPDPCLNGGRCISSSKGPKCICPERTFGPICKQLSRTFRSGGWAWVDPIPSCSYVHISLEFLTNQKDCLILYTGPGPDQPQGRDGKHPLLQGDVLCLELRNGLPRLLLDIGSNPVVLFPKPFSLEKQNLQNNADQLSGQSLETETNLNSNDKSTTSFPIHLADEQWHRLDVIWGAESVELLIDLCQNSFENCHIKAPLSGDGFQSQTNTSQRRRNLAPRTPLQLGGLAYPPPSSLDRGWDYQISQNSLSGCIRNLRVNKRLYDLGKDLLSNNSEAGCQNGDFCEVWGEKCPRNSKCVGPPNSGTCECLPGWTGEVCDQPTVSATFGNESYVRVALSFLPSNRSTSIQLRFRSWSAVGQLMLITSQHSRDQMSLFLENGRLCFLLAIRDLSHNSWSSKSQPFTVCLSKVALNDGQWHAVYAKRYGIWTELWVDSGEWPLYNASFTPHLSENNFKFQPEVLPLIAENVNQRPEIRWGTEMLIVDRQEGVHIGGVPEYVGANLHAVHHDFEGCIDDVRLEGKSLPLPPSQNTSKWAQATTFGSSITSHCSGSPVCDNITCPDPLECVDFWRRHHCGCTDGKVFTSDSSSCQDVNECIWDPCLNGGICINHDPGYYCACPIGFLGDNCEFEGTPSNAISLTVGVLIATASWIFLFLIVVSAFIIQHKCRRKNKRKTSKELESPDTGVSTSFYNSGELRQSSSICTHSKMMELRVLQEPSFQLYESGCSDENHTGEKEVDVLRIGLERRTETGEGTIGRNQRKGGLNSKVERSGNTKAELANGRSITLERKANSVEKKDVNKEKNLGCGTCGQIVLPCDDLRNYAYEGEGNSPGSLSSCCSGTSNSKGTEKLIGGFQEVATLLYCLNSDNDSPKKLCKASKDWLSKSKEKLAQTKLNNEDID